MIAKMTFDSRRCYEHNIEYRLNEWLRDRGISDDQIISINEVGGEIIIWYKEEIS